MPGFFWLIFHADARMRGWGELAARFRTRDEIPANLRTGQDGAVGRVGLIQTRRMLRTAITDKGLYLAMPRWVRAAHPPLLIPWSDLQVTSCATGLTGEARVELEAVTSPTSRHFIILRGGVAANVIEKIDAASGQCVADRG